MLIRNWGRLVPAALLLFLLPTFAFSASSHRAQARAEFAKAEEMRAQLEARPEAKRKAADYQAVLRHYDKAVQLGPGTSSAPESLLAAGKLYADMARLFPGHKYDELAAGKYQFLIKSYPKNKHVAEARQALDGLAVDAAAMPAPAPAPTEVKLAALEQPSGRVVQVTSVRHWATPSYTRVVMELDGAVEYQAGRIANPDRIFFDLHQAHLSAALRNQTLSGDDGLLKRVRMAQNQTGIVRIVLEVGQVRDYSAFLLPNPYRLIVDINGGTPKVETVTASVPKKSTPREDAEKAAELTAPVSSSDAPSSKPVFERVEKAAPPPAPPPVVAEERAPTERDRASETETPKPAPKPTAEKRSARKEPVLSAAEPHTALPTSSGDRSLTRVLGLKIGRIVIDAGHGGHDTGTIGPNGLLEKDLVLDVAKKLGAMIEDRLGGEVVYTRSDDTFIPLETRTAIANQKQADLFVSIHANSSRDKAARGIETYYLNFTSAPDALEVAARENAVSEKSVYELQDLVKKITLKEKLEESREFASEVQKSLMTTMSRGNTGLRNRGVRKAPFVVLIGANMPSILAEISFVSNPTDERLLKKPEYRQKIAEALYRGIQRYANSLSGVKVAHSRLSE